MKICFNGSGTIRDWYQMLITGIVYKRVHVINPLTDDRTLNEFVSENQRGKPALLQRNIVDS